MSFENDLFTGEFEYNLKSAYKIPRKVNEQPAPPGTSDIPLGNSNEESIVSPLAALPTAQSAGFSALSVDKLLLGAPPPPPPPPLDSKPVEKPPTRKRPHVLARHEGLPEELTKLMQPLSCVLCTVKLNSIITANIHYESKTHEKKVNSWLAEWSARTGEPLPKRLPQREGPTGPNAIHCDVCDLALTSIQHAKQHYQGKKHRQVMAGRSKPSGSGYFDANNKWIRVDTKTCEDLANRFFIGTSFLVKSEDGKKTETESDEYLEMPPTPNINDLYDDTEESAWNITADDEPKNEPVAVTSPAAITKVSTTATSPASKEPTIQEHMAAIKKVNVEKVPGRYCEICNISVTSEVHMKLHLNGAKHAKKLRQLDAPPYAPINDTISQCLMVNSDGKHSQKASGNQIDYSVYRTPSGQYYCQVCNITVTSEIMLKQHFGSKKHMKVAATANKK